MIDQRCAHLMELVVDSLKGMKESDITSGLKNSIDRLAEYETIKSSVEPTDTDFVEDCL